ncbi:hypothetical protein SAMN06265222_11237 [Neorhodopirellula lusitana]|uniref:Chromosome partition protein Smc n=1 Tax=Neorhodopirellula lusitana TaxID=445327 RepID=A0ABY1QGZ5_9BACT|nr:hypothetical protein [Neorhodopirellula lusitana]SMP69423.1 hypothetical protein SAMN06265222_11237 [Neorhodopirellula lusitana]
MVARDDSVIRGSLIACLIFLVLSLALNFFLYRWGDVESQTAASAKDRLQTTQGEVQTLQSQSTLMKAMLGVGGLTQAQFEQLTSSTGGDPDIEAIEQNFARDMAYFGPEVDPQNRNYPALPEFLVNAIRSRNVQYGQARDEATQIRSQAESDVEVARKAMEVAESGRDQANKKLEEESSKFADDREKMNLQSAQTRDSLLKTSKDLTIVRKKIQQDLATFKKRENELLSTVNMQLIELQRYRSDQFETTQGLIKYVVRGGNVVTINLGSSDALRPGVTFGVIDADETRLQDAKIKATVQVTKILGDHRAEARVVARPEFRYPIIPGDQIYSPFWAPGRRVKIALAWNIDIDGDERYDIEHVASMVRAAGAEVDTTIQEDLTGLDELDSGVRFLVFGEPPEVDDDASAREIQALGKIKAKAKEVGVTVIPAWKLQAYLKTIDDSLTTPLGSAVRGRDFPPVPSKAASRIPNSLPKMFLESEEGIQKDNKILQP